MSRVAKAPVILPKGVEITVNSTNITVKGPKGQLDQDFNKRVQIEKNDKDQLIFSPAANESDAWQHAGTVRAIVNNMVKGVTDGFERTLELVGVGYRAQSKGSSIALSLGYSHPIEYQLPKGVTADTPSNTVIVLKSIDKQLLGQVASEIRSYRPPEPYKGKGIRYAGERIVIKETKKK